MTVLDWLFIGGISSALICLAISVFFFILFFLVIKQYKVLEKKKPRNKKKKALGVYTSQT